MNIFLLGATGRVGKEFLRLALAAGHTVSALVRDASKIPAAPSLTLFTGDIYQEDALRSAFSSGTWDAVVNLIGTDPLKASTLVSDTARALVALCQETHTSRYLAISGTAEMPHTGIGGITIFVMRRTPIGHAIRDHDAALDIVASSSLDWALVGCPWIKDGPGRGTYTTADTFPGGMKSIHPADVALAVFRELDTPAHHQQIFGIWY